MRLDVAVIFCFDVNLAGIVYAGRDFVELCKGDVQWHGCFLLRMILYALD